MLQHSFQNRRTLASHQFLMQKKCIGDDYNNINNNNHNINKDNDKVLRTARKNLDENYFVIHLFFWCVYMLAHIKISDILFFVLISWEMLSCGSLKTSLSFQSPLETCAASYIDGKYVLIFACSKFHLSSDLSACNVTHGSRSYITQIDVIRIIIFVSLSLLILWFFYFS